MNLVNGCDSCSELKVETAVGRGSADVRGRGCTYDRVVDYSVLDANAFTRFCCNLPL